MDPVHSSQDTVIETGLSVGMCIDDLFCAVFLGHTGKDTLRLQNVGRRVVEEHDIFRKAVRFCCLEGFSQAGCFPLHQLFGVGFLLLIPVDDPPAVVQIKGALEGISLGPDDGIVLICFVIVLEKKEIRGTLCVELRSLFGVPAHIMVSAQKDFTAGEISDVLKVCLALGQVFAPAVISDQNKGVLRPDHLRAVFTKLFFMIFPYPAVELSRRPELGLKMQVKISDRIQAHAHLCCLPLLLCICFLVQLPVFVSCLITSRLCRLSRLL